MPSNLVCNICKRTFIYPEKQITYQFNGIDDPKNAKFIHPGDSVPISQIEKQVCPFCYEPDIAVQEEPLQQEKIGNVYVYELTTGPQTELDKLLADGYVPMNRTSKQYVLEKPAAKTGLEKLEEAEK